MPDTELGILKMYNKEKAKELIASYEREFLTGSFSESNIKTDLEMCRTKDNLSTLGSLGRQTYELSRKRNWYIETCNEVLDGINRILGLEQEEINHRSEDTTFISRCENCKNRVTRMLNIVRNF